MIELVPTLVGWFAMIIGDTATLVKFRLACFSMRIREPGIVKRCNQSAETQLMNSSIPSLHPSRCSCPRIGPKLDRSI